MALIDSNNFIIHLVWSGLVDKATCGELKEAIELCTVKDIYTKADMVAMLEDLKLDIEYCVDAGEALQPFEDGVNTAKNQVLAMIDERINGLRG